MNCYAVVIGDWPTEVCEDLHDLYERGEGDLDGDVEERRVATKLFEPLERSGSSRRGGEGLAMVSSIGVGEAIDIVLTVGLFSILVSALIVNSVNSLHNSEPASSTTGSNINFLLLLSVVVTFSYSLPEVFGFAAQNNSVELTCSSANRAFSIFELPCKDVDDSKIMDSLFIDEVISRPEELCIPANKKFETRKYETLKMEMIKILV
ncbi:hypothetical protein GQX74_004687 [Glossina fuscipes]|nr:hypothetical protein GQX74_004687 [Glossina fuscipes]